MTKAHAPVSPIDAAKALTPRWMLNIKDFDALEIHPCTVIGNDSEDTSALGKNDPVACV